MEFPRLELGGILAVGVPHDALYINDNALPLRKAVGVCSLNDNQLSIRSSVGIQEKNKK